MEDFRKTLKDLPRSPGVYLFKNSRGIVLYVGKAINIHSRVKQHFTSNSPFVPYASAVETMKTASEFDALLLEASLIRKYLPKYNVASRDDKSPLYISLTFHEKLPHILFLRKKQLKNEVVFGPFQSARTARSLMRNIRRIIPFCVQNQRTGRPCFYTHLHLCDPCPSVIAKMKPGEERSRLTRLYRKHMFQIRDILSGKSTKVSRTFQGDMESFAKENKFEEAQAMKRQMQGLYDLVTRTFDVNAYLENENFTQNLGFQELTSLLEILKPNFPKLQELTRIECIDIANIAGREATGSLVVLKDGMPQNSEYKRFRIRIPHVPNDVAMIAEVVTRRMKHPEWPYPDLLVVDGGKPQVAAAMHVLTIPIPVIGLAKRLEEIVLLTGSDPVKPVFKTILLPLTSPGVHVLQRIRDEAHRFARRYHHLLRGKRLFDTINKP